MIQASRAVIFDFDGVIADSEVISNRELAEALTEIGLSTSFEDCLSLYYGRNWIECERRIVGQLGGPLPAGFTAALRSTVDNALARELAPVPGAQAFVRRRAGLPMAIASSSDPAYLISCLARFELETQFGRHLYSAAQLDRGKPHPDIYLMAAAGLGIVPNACLVIEDSPVGVTAAVAAGMTVIGLLAGGHVLNGQEHGDKLRGAGAHYLAQSFDQIEHFLAHS